MRLFAGAWLRIYLKLTQGIFGKKVRNIRHSKGNSSGIVDGCHNTSGISQLFANKYKDLYSNAAYCDTDNILVDIN